MCIAMDSVETSEQIDRRRRHFFCTSAATVAAQMMLGLVIALLVTVAGLLLFRSLSLTNARHQLLSLLQSVELRSLDARFLLRGPRPHDPRIVIIGIDDKCRGGRGLFFDCDPVPHFAWFLSFV